MDQPSTPARLAAIILAGGRARRLAGADKPASLVGGRRLIDIALAAVPHAEQIVVVGPDRDLPARVQRTRENPPFAGPVAAVAAGAAVLDDVPDDCAVAVLAADLPFLTAEHIDALAARRADVGAPVVLALDDDNRPQYLVGVWRAAALRTALRTAHASMRSLIPDDAETMRLSGIADVDTPEDLAAARRHADPVAALAAAATDLDPAAPRHTGVDESAGAVLAEPLRAAVAFPAFDTAAMDGYAVRGSGPWRLVGSAVRAGHDGQPLTEPGTAVSIATGAALPPGADRVIRHEEVAARSDGSVLTSTSSGRDDTRRRGSSWAVGDVLAAAGTTVDAALIGTARGAGVTRLVVRGPLRATVHTSGDEVGSPTASGITDTASPPVATLLSGFGARVAHGPHLPDSPAALAGALGPDRVPGDLVVVIGATGRGAADHLRAALARIGARLLIDGLPLRPGGSLLIAALPDGGVLLGLGGNPVAAVAGAALCVPTLRDALLGARPGPPEYLSVLDAAAVAHPDLWRVVPVCPDGAGGWLASAITSTAELRSLIGARTLALVPPASAGSARRLV